ncbi:molecular chaperone TorD family protein [Parasalinivibrio latis]|uniref:TorD/DmsD family molecular chaperone n=1 Tax=Parasalinivibrio latis TaxID=2952610 RepID=UPI0030E3A756
MQNDVSISRLLGALLYHSPGSETATSILNAFAEEENELLNVLAESASQTDPDALEADFFALLQGSGDMPCPPWGSVYLDNENALFGASTLEYRGFLSSVGLSCDTGLREPEDHIGLMLMMLSVLLENGGGDNAKALLSRHIMPFAPMMLEEMEKHAETAFYQGLAAITNGWLMSFCEETGVVADARRIYWERV